MLKGVPSVLSPSLLKALMEMGHGDELVIGDGNFPSNRLGKNATIIRADGHGTEEILEAILQFLPLDSYVDFSVILMKVGKHRNIVPIIWDSYKTIIKKHEPNVTEFCMLERFDFYDRAKKAYVVIATSEKQEFANIILKKGVVKN